MNQEKKNAVKYLKIAKGQIEGIIKMIEDERYCIDISNQIIASQSLLKKANSEIIKQHLTHCVKNSCCEGDLDTKLEEVMMIIEKLAK
ncbi:metal-sensing transcriptional repressor [Clostridium senegalense]|uniref:metal-sensing transcriptional repressor n=1 Tax=Clostridium senegalense TaxID=1465809 RepID=UPI001C10BB13|nr:metal-sensing transcriptional repressor [Clostridium senegalense]MBU5227754.1 metal-sensing transcriptional repressor [Clostridium senegalense]